MKPMIMPTAVQNQSASSYFLRTHTREKNILPPIMAPILTKTQVSLDCSCSAIRLAFERFKLPWASGTRKVPETHTLVKVGRANTAGMAGRRGHFGGSFELTAEQFRRKEVSLQSRKFAGEIN